MISYKNDSGYISWCLYKFISPLTHIVVPVLYNCMINHWLYFFRFSILPASCLNTFLTLMILYRLLSLGCTCCKAMGKKQTGNGKIVHVSIV